MAVYQLARYLLCPTDGGLYKIWYGLFDERGQVGRGMPIAPIASKGGVGLFIHLARFLP